MEVRLLQQEQWPHSISVSVVTAAVARSVTPPSLLALATVVSSSHTIASTSVSAVVCAVTSVVSRICSDPDGELQALSAVLKLLWEQTLSNQRRLETKVPPGAADNVKRLQ